ncbi:MAG: hypothetical protein WCW36_01525 [Candidatus Paceibacterota bacterium]
MDITRIVKEISTLKKGMEVQINTPEQAEVMMELECLLSSYARAMCFPRKCLYMHILENYMLLFSENDMFYSIRRELLMASLGVVVGLAVASAVLSEASLSPAEYEERRSSERERLVNLAVAWLVSIAPVDFLSGLRHLVFRGRRKGIILDLLRMFKM